MWNADRYPREYPQPVAARNSTRWNTGGRKSAWTSGLRRHGINLIVVGAFALIASGAASAVGSADLPMDAHRASHLFPPELIAQIQRTAEEGHYEIRGLGAKRRLPHFDDLVFLGASLSRYPLEGYREKCSSTTVLGTRFAKRPIELAMPITIAGMSFGALSANVKEALGRAATELGTSTTTGDGGMTPEERRSEGSRWLAVAARDLHAARLRRCAHSARAAGRGTARRR